MTEKKLQEIPWGLIISNFKGEISDEEHARLSRWAENPDCRSVMEELKSLWRNIQLKSASYTPDKTQNWKILSERIHRTEGTDTMVKTTKSVSLRSFYRYAVAACLILAVGIAYYLGGQRAVSEYRLEQVYSCLDGKSRITLPDGSVVWLHGHTTLAYNDFQGRDRLVKVAGEAFFEVAKDAEKQFVVQTEGLRVVVHGTKFNVEAPDSAEESRISLMEGAVSLETSSHRIFMQPGDVVVYNRKDNRLVRMAGDTDFDRMWMKDELIMLNGSLGEVCRHLSKWYGVKINLEEGLEKKYEYTFTLHAEKLDEVLRLMSRITPISYHFDEANVLTISSAEEP